MNQHQTQHSNTVARGATPDFQHQPLPATRTEIAITNAYRLGYLDGFDDQPRSPHLHRFTHRQIKSYNAGHEHGQDECDNNTQLQRVA